MEVLERRYALATIAVTGPGDTVAVDGIVTLREAIISANNNANVNSDVSAVGTYGADTISLPAGTYTLTGAADEDAAASGDLDITGSLTINGAGSATTIIQAGTTNANGVDRVLDIIGDGLTVHISGVTIRNGNLPGTGDGAGAGSGEGGGIFIHGSSEPLSATNVTITNSVIQNNTAGEDGGGISNISLNANLVLTGVTVTGNHALNRDGGGILHVPDAGDLTLTDSTVSNNTGRQPGGVFVGGGDNDLIVSGSTISNNTATAGIGGIEFDPSNGNLTITRSTISDNDGGPAEVGGILFGVGSGDMLITESIISGNTSGDNGGGLELNDDDGTMSIVNSTISGNRSGTNGGGIHVSGSSPLNLTNVTITGNTADNDDNLSGDGGGIFATSTVNLLNTIVAGNTDMGGQAPDISGTVTSQGHNLIRSTAGATINGNATGDIIGVDPLLGPLADNGGPTQTHELLAGSPAIDAGSDSVLGAPLSLTTDQRGSGFPRLIGAHVDIGAFEAGIAPPPPEGGLPTCDIETLNEAGAQGSAVLETDADTEESNVLLVTGTSRSDVIIIEPRPSDSSQIRVKINGHLAGIFASSNVPRIVAFGLGGNDTIIVNATLHQSATLFGGAGNDFLFGGAGNDQLEGDAGNDHLFGLAGDDTLCGDDGNDFLFGGLGNDTLFGEAGKDQLFGEAGDDLLIAGEGNDFAFGGTGNDQLFGQAGNDQLFGETGNDIVVGGAGNDKLFGSTGHDLLIGGAGSDQLFGEAHDDILIAGSTTFDESPDALSAILAEWTSGNNYFTRIDNLRTGGGASGGFTLDSTTVLDDGAIDTLWGHGGQDWFLIGTGDKLKDRASGELLN